MRATSPLRAFVAERGAGEEACAAASTETVDAHAVRRHLTMDRRLKGDERQHVGGLDPKGAAGGMPRLETRDELAEKLHRSLGSSRASLE